MSDTIFRSAVESTNTPPPADKAVSGPQTASPTTVEVPFNDYLRENSHPFSVDYFQLGDTWQDPDGGFYKEVSTIEGYLKGEIDSGELANSTAAVKEKMKQIEKLINLNKEERTTIKIATIAAYMKFLDETKQVKNNVRKYGRT
jgi:hypothetical protein